MTADDRVPGERPPRSPWWAHRRDGASRRQMAVMIAGPAFAAACFYASYALGGSQWSLVAGTIFTVQAIWAVVSEALLRRKARQG